MRFAPAWISSCILHIRPSPLLMTYMRRITAEGDNGLNHVNLALKGIMGVQAMSLISAALGEDDDASLYANDAASLIDQWSEAALQGDHVNSIYNDPYSTGLLYNLFADKLLKTALVPDHVRSYTRQFSDTSHIVTRSIRTRRASTAASLATTLDGAFPITAPRKPLSVPT